MERWEAVLAEITARVDPDSPASDRLREATDFVAFVRADLPELMARWHKRRAAPRRGQGRRPS
jgi:hypothetical protein